MFPTYWLSWFQVLYLKYWFVINKGPFNELILKSNNWLPQLFVHCDIQTWTLRQVQTSVCMYVLHVLHIINLMKLGLCY